MGYVIAGFLLGVIIGFIAGVRVCGDGKGKNE